MPSAQVSEVIKRADTQKSVPKPSSKARATAEIENSPRAQRDLEAHADMFPKGGPPSAPDKEESDEELDALMLELEAEVENEPLGFDVGNTDYIDELLEDESIDASSQADAELLQEALEGLFLSLETNQALADGMQTELTVHQEIVKENSIEELEKIDDYISRINEVSNIISAEIGTPIELDESELASLSQEEEDPELAELMRELDESDMDFSASEQAIEMYEQSIDRIIEIDENIESINDQQQIIYTQITALQVKLGILHENETRTKVSYKRKKQMKTGAKRAMTAVKYLVPVTAVPIKIAKASLAVVSLAKTIKHILNLKKLLAATKSPEVKSVLIYAIRQKSKKAVKKGLTSVGAGALSSAHSGIRGIYKKIKGTKGVERESYAKLLHGLAIKGDQEAGDVIRELVGTENMAAALENSSEGWGIVKSKLASK